MSEADRTPEPPSSPVNGVLFFLLAVGAVALGVDLAIETWGESAAGWWLGGAAIVCIVLAFSALFVSRPLAVVALGLVWCCAVGTWLYWPTFGRGGALGLGLGDDARTAFVLTILAALLPLAVALARVRLWAVWLVPLWLYVTLPFVAGIVRDEPFEDFPLFQAFWGDVPALVQPAQLLLVYLPLSGLMCVISALIGARPARDRVLEIVGWLMVVVATCALCFTTVRAAHMPSVLRSVWPPAEGVGEAILTMADGSEIRVTTAGYDALTAQQRAGRARWRIQLRGTRGADASGATRIWINVLDPRGRTVLDRRREDFDVYDSSVPRRRFKFEAHPDEGPPSFAPPHIWIANSVEGTVTKLSTRSGDRVGHYRVGPDPSRTSVDLDGNVYVAQRAAGALTKILAGGCDGQGCLAWSVPTCEGTRGLAVARDNSVWVGGSKGAEGCLERRSPDDGRLLFTVALSSRVYGLAVDQRGHLWAVLDQEGVLLRFRADGRLAGTFPAPRPNSLYGIAIDSAGRVWLGNNISEGVWRFDPETEAWDRFVSEERRNAQSRGLAADAAGNVWVASSNLGIVSRFEADTGRWLGDFSSGGLQPVGVAIDGDQFVWVVNQRSNSAVRIDPATGDIVGTYATGEGPYTYSDMTGYALHNFVARSGTYRLAWRRTPLRVSILRPERGQRIPALSSGDPLGLAARIETFDPEDPVERVEWWVDGVMVDESPSAPWPGHWAYDEVALGPHTVEVRGYTRDGFMAVDKTVVEAVRTFGRLSVRLERAGQRLDRVPRTIEFVVDSSGSMWGPLPRGPDGTRERKVDAARRALEALFATLPEDTQVSLRAYGHRSKRCDDTELLVAPSAADPAHLSEVVRGLRPLGRTPIAGALRAAGDDLSSAPGRGYLGERMIVLVTDGVETCKGDPCAEALALSQTFRLRAHVVGFGLGSPAESQTLRCIAEAGGGTYADADDADELRRVLEEAIRVQFQVVEVDTGRVVHSGGLDAARPLLPVGRYAVRFGSSASAAVLSSEPFDVTDGATVEVALRLVDDGPPEIVVVHAGSDDRNSPK